MSRVLNEYRGHVKAVERGERRSPAYSVLVEFPEGGGPPAITAFGMDDIGSRETLSVFCGAMQFLASASADLNAQASN